MSNNNNCFICGEEIDSEKLIINKIAVCLKCTSEADPAENFKVVKDIIAAYNDNKKKK